MPGKVSVVVPCYNKEAYIADTLRSIRDQIWNNVEVLLVNDGSTDGTRDIIEQWVPQLEDRGYKVVVIDQENGGCCAAVYAGLTRMTGDYFCLVDADDEIDPAYMSTMAGFLDENEEYEWAACTYQRLELDENGNSVRLPAWHTDVPQDTLPLLENYLLMRTITMSWIYMVRTRYIQRCRMVERFCTERRKTYEPCVFIPLATGGGKIKFFDEPLYLFNRQASELSVPAALEGEFLYHEDYGYLTEYTLKKLHLDAQMEYRYIHIARLVVACKCVFSALERQDDKYYKIFLADVLKQLYLLYPTLENLNADQILDMGFSPFFEILKFKFFEFEQIFYDDHGAPKRVIGLGCLGKRAKAKLPLLRQVNFPITELWDNGATEHSFFEGLPVQTPNFASLPADAIVLVFPTNADAVADIRKTLSKANVNTVWYNDTINEFLGLFTTLNCLGNLQQCQIV